MEAVVCRPQGWECYEWATVCKESSTPVLTPEEWAAYFGVAHLVYDEDLRKDHGWIWEISPMDGQCECQPAEGDWYTIGDPYVRLHHWEFVGDPPDLTVPGTYTLKAVFTNDLIPDPVRCNPCVCPDGTENCEACQKCPAKKAPNLRDPDVERLFTIWVVETKIIWPKYPTTVQQGGALSNSFLTDGGCYRQSNQAVVIGALGTNQPLARVEGTISPAAFSPWWEIDEHLGTLLPQDAIAPTHTPPAEPGNGNIYLYAQRDEDKVCPDSVSITVYPDHLARDLANFYPYLRCSPTPPRVMCVPDCVGSVSAGLQLSDHSCVASISLTCANSVSHAIFGEKGKWGVNGPAAGGTQAYTLLDEGTNLEAKTLQQFQQMQIQRGDVIQAGYTPSPGEPDEPFAGIHVCIATEDNPGWLVETHAGDSVTGIFRRETPYNYYYTAWHFWKNENWYCAPETSSPQEWIDEYARLKVWRRNSAGE